MKKILLSAGLAGLLAVAGGAVQAADQDIVIGAEVPTSCTVGTVSGDTATIGITSGNVDTSVITKSYDVSCNAPAYASLSSAGDGLSGPASAGGFENYINYTAATSGFASAGPGTTAGGTNAPNAPLGSDDTAGASAVPVDVTITPIANTDPLVAGSYEDTLTLTINPI